MEAPWVVEARRYIGVREVPGKPTSPVIASWLLSLKAWWRDDETPWCGVFVGYCLQTRGIQIPRAWYRAKAYLEWGTPCALKDGAVAVFERNGGGHVGFVVGVDPSGRVMTLGGNQGNTVSVMPFSPERVIGYRWPPTDFQSTGATRIVSVAPSSLVEA